MIDVPIYLVARLTRSVCRCDLEELMIVQAVLSLVDRRATALSSLLQKKLVDCKRNWSAASLAGSCVIVLWYL